MNSLTLYLAVQVIGSLSALLLGFANLARRGAPPGSTRGQQVVQFLINVTMLVWAIMLLVALHT